MHDFEEKIYLKDEHVKVTNLRLTANHVTVPIEKIENVAVNFKATSLSVSFAAFLASLALIVAGCRHYGHCCWFGLIFAVGALVYLIKVYRTYTALEISTGSRTFKLLDASMLNRECIFRVEEALNEAMSDQ